MIVCHCQAVNDRAIRRAVREGARTPRQVFDACGASRTCGGCARAVVDVIASESHAQQGAVAELAPAS